MPKGKRKPYDGLRPPSLRGVVVVADVNGTPRFSKWPRPPGKNRNPVNVQWTNWLKAVTYLYRYQPAKVQALFQRATANTPWMPRDPFISGVRGRAWSITDEDGRTWYPMPARQAVSQSLDAITQLAGKMLIRGATGWEATDPPSGGAPLEAWIPPSLNPFSTNGRWAGVKCTMGETVTLEALAWQGTISGSSTYGALVAEVDASNVITAVTLSPQRSGLASPITGSRKILWHEFTTPLTLASGTTYVLMVGRPSHSAGIPMPGLAAQATAGPYQFPWEGVEANQRSVLDTVTPTTGDTITVATQTPVALAARFTRA